MGYEYEGKSNISFSIGNKLHFWNVTDDNLREELQEIYAKAKAWQTLKEELLTEYPYLVRVWESTHGEGEHAEMSKANEILERMDELDGTHEFRNLLDDMNREDK